VTAKFLVDSIDGLTASGAIRQEFVGIILLPVVGNAAGVSSQWWSIRPNPQVFENIGHVTAVTGSFEDKLILSLSVVLSSSLVGSIHVSNQ